MNFIGCEIYLIKDVKKERERSWGVSALKKKSSGSTYSSLSFVFSSTHPPPQHIQVLAQRSLLCDPNLVVTLKNEVLQAPDIPVSDDKLPTHGLQCTGHTGMPKYRSPQSSGQPGVAVGCQRHANILISDRDTWEKSWEVMLPSKSPAGPLPLC